MQTVTEELPPAAKGRNLQQVRPSVPNAPRSPASAALTVCQLGMVISTCFVKDYSKINFTA